VIGAKNKQRLPGRFDLRLSARQTVLHDNFFQAAEASSWLGEMIEPMLDLRRERGVIRSVDLAESARERLHSQMLTRSGSHAMHLNIMKAILPIMALTI
jgi:hypothetical protein